MISKNLHFYKKSPSSILSKIKFSYVIICLLMIIPILFSLSISFLHTKKYDSIITNVSNANRLSQIVKIEISDEIWDIVAGKIEFNKGSQYEIIEKIKSAISKIMLKTENEENKQVLEVANRAVNTLEKYVNMLGIQIANNAAVHENEKILEDIRSVAGLIYDILQNFIVAEIELSANANIKIKNSFYIFITIYIIIIFISITFIIYFTKSISKNIKQPIDDMVEFSTQIAKGNLSVRAHTPNIIELNNLTSNLNIMAEKIYQLIQQNIKEQQNLQKAEMKTLQAQITPHFLYNTFDSIIWLSEAGKTEDVINITKAFSNFFRISLSRGHEWISLEQELDHVKNYLTIQRIRYRDILDYYIEFDEDLVGADVLKLILQPLVENAIYHGIKNKRGKGKIIVKAKLIEENNDKKIFLSVEDNGIGFTTERLQEVKNELEKNLDSENLSSVYGLYNVSKRLNLYYNENIIFNIESEYKKGSCISFKIPFNKPGGTNV